jgi:hypothetical protein
MYPLLHSSSRFDREYTDALTTMTEALSQTAWPLLGTVPTEVRALLSLFFEIGDSNAPNASHRLAQEVFAEDGQIVVNKNVISGAQGKFTVSFMSQRPGDRSANSSPVELAASNSGMIPGMESRQHRIDKIYICSHAADDLVLIGNVKWTLKDGKELWAPLAARAVIDLTNDSPRIKLFQGFTVRLPKTPGLLGPAAGITLTPDRI